MRLPVKIGSGGGEYCQNMTIADGGGDTVESTRIEPFLGENRVILD